MTTSTHKIEILSKGLAANGPSIGLGVPSMIIGLITFIGGIATVNSWVIVIGFCLLALAAYLILSIDCIAFDKENNQLRLYKDYFITTKGEWITLNKYTSVSLYYEIDSTKSDRYTYNDYQYKTFEVHLTSDSDHLLIKDFGELEPARKLQLLISQKTGLKYIDKAIREFEPKNSSILKSIFIPK